MTDDEFQAVLGKGEKGEKTMEADESERVVQQCVEETTEEQPENAEQLEEERQEPETHQEETLVVTK